MSYILSKSISRISLNIRSHSSRSSLISIKQRSFNNKPTKLAWSEAVQKAESLVNPTSKPLIDFKQIVQDDLSILNQNIKELLSSGHPVLNTIAQYHFNVGGKHIRPIIVLLLSQATSIAAKKAEIPTSVDIDQPIDQKFTLNGSRWKDDYNAHGKPNSEQFVSKCSEGCTILPSQRRLAELAEVIHTASLFHDDVIDNSDLRRNAPSVNAQFGNKMAILGGDFLLARASMSLARLRNVQVVELMSTVIANLVEGELLQIKDALPTEHCDTNGPNDQVFEYYLEKTYLKTASLIANSCRGAAVLGNTTDEIRDIAYEYGKNLGMAFQLIDDMLDFVVSADEFGKPVGADLELGLTTAPVLFAWQEFPELGPMIKRKFSEPGDVEKVRELVFESQGLHRTKELAINYCKLATDAISQLPYSESREALIQLCEKVIERKR